MMSAEQRLSIAKAQLYAAELASACDGLHELGFVHCDLKLENILVDEEGHTMLADFGFTQRLHKPGDGEEENVPKGHTLCYTPPEVLNGAEVGPSTDWWGVGCLIYEYHHGLPPFYHQSERKMTRAIMRAVS